MEKALPALSIHFASQKGNLGANALRSLAGISHFETRNPESKVRSKSEVELHKVIVSVETSKENMLSVGMVKVKVSLLFESLQVFTVGGELFLRVDVSQ